MKLGIIKPKGGKDTYVRKFISSKVSEIIVCASPEMIKTVSDIAFIRGTKISSVPFPDY